MVASVTGSAGFSAAMFQGSQCRGTRDTQSQQTDKTALQENLFSKLDVDGNGSIDATELSSFMSYAASASGAASATDSSALFGTLDADGDGAISQTEMADGAKSLFDELRTQLLSGSDDTEEAAPPEPPDATAMFAQIDANGDGSIDQSELGTFFEQGPPPPPPGGPPPGEGGGGSFMSKIESLLSQYRSTATDSTQSTSSTLSVAA